MRNYIINFCALLFGEAEQIKVEQVFVKIEETQNRILAIESRDHFNTNVEGVAAAIAEDIHLHVTRLWCVGSHGNIGAARKLAHKNTITIASDVGDWMQNTIHAHADADFSAEIFNMNIRGC